MLAFSTSSFALASTLNVDHWNSVCMSLGDASQKVAVGGGQLAKNDPVCSAFIPFLGQVGGKR